MPQTNPSPHLSEAEWAEVESFLGHPVRRRDEGEHAFWEDTFINDQGLLDSFKRHAWVGDRVLNLALADRREAIADPMKVWNGPEHQTREQAEDAAVDAWRDWPPPIQGMLRLGNAKQGVANDRIVGTYVEAIIGLLFREHGYDAAREFVWKHWPYSR